MKCRILLLEEDLEYGTAMEAYFEKRKKEGELVDWEFNYIRSEEDEISIFEDGQAAFILIGTGYSEKDILLKLKNSGSADKEDQSRYDFDYLTEQEDCRFYRYGGVECLMKDIEFKRLHKNRSELEVKNETMVISGVGLAGGVGNTTILLELNETLKARGFKTAYIDLNYWGNTNQYVRGEKMIELSYLRFVFNRDPAEFERNFTEILRETGKENAVLISGIAEIDCSMETQKQDVEEIVKRMTKQNNFDFILLDGNKHMLANGELNEFGVDELLVTDIEKEDFGGEDLINRISSYFTATIGFDIVKIMNKIDIDALEKWKEHTQSSSFPVFSFPKKDSAEKEGSKNISEGLRWVKGGKKAESKKAGIREGIEGGALADYMIRRWMETEK